MCGGGVVPLQSPVVSVGGEHREDRTGKGLAGLRGERKERAKRLECSAKIDGL